jgi:hypothetical protein
VKGPSPGQRLPGRTRLLSASSESYRGKLETSLSESESARAGGRATGNLSCTVCRVRLTGHSAARLQVKLDDIRVEWALSELGDTILLMISNLIITGIIMMSPKGTGPLSLSRSLSVSLSLSESLSVSLSLSHSQTLSLSLSLTHTNTRRSMHRDARTHARTHTHTHEHAHAHTRIHTGTGCLRRSVHTALSPVSGVRTWSRCRPPFIRPGGRAAGVTVPR